MSKMKKKPVKLIVSALAASSLLVTSCEAGDNILTRNFVYANFESYMSPNLQSELRSTYKNLQFDTFSSNENAITNFKNKTYTIGTLSTYAVLDLISQGILQKLDWTKFDLTYLNDEGQEVPVNNATDALPLFTTDVQKILTSYSINGQPVNLLDYAVPYFFQSLVFAYRGPKIESLVDHESSWYDVLSTISSEKYRDRFNNSLLGIVEDERSIYSIGNVIQTTKNGGAVSVNPPPSQLSLEQFYDVYKQIADAGVNYKNLAGKVKSTALLSSDATVIINNLVSKRNTGGIMFNGDAIFSAQGGEFHGEDGDPLKPTSENYHIITPVNTPLALDMIVINRLNIQQFPGFLDQSYEVIKKVGLQGVNETLEDFQAVVGDNPDDPNPVYKNGPLENFNYVQYTSPLKIISDPETGLVATEGWLDVADEEELTNNINSTYFIHGVENLKNFVEAPLNDIQKSSLINAFARFKNNWLK
ncbi:spermidine/putrescine ABC transporter substrate-binding protein [[Mycoplasma] imitans]|uniref:spermidine/putrescine ABC transporter substrate-binding protein n=1 Tax=[Mycoplasma] imitans TaxID=29560 RepID=UPI000487BD54|nr:spermidine/putrescine ABC transporter substrate-binding protein [[Mycoplasma] imitans]